MESVKSKWEMIVDAAYEKWSDNRPFEQFLMCLDGQARQAVVLNVLDCQVRNGGIQQWVDNGYCVATFTDLTTTLRLVGTPRALELVDKVERFVKRHVDLSSRYRGFGQNYWKADEDESDYDYMVADADEFDSAYYEEQFESGLLQEIEKYFNAGS